MRLIILLSICLIGCSSINTSKPKPVIVEVPVIVKCINQEDLPVRPYFKTDAELLNMSAGEFVRNLHIDRLMKDIYISKLETVIEACK